MASPRQGGGSGGGGGGGGGGDGRGSGSLPQLTPGATYLQAECAQLLQKVQALDRGFAAKEAEANREREEIEMEKKQAELEIKREREGIEMEKKEARLEITMERSTHEDRVRWEKERLREEKREIEERRERSEAVFAGKEQLITIEVGGEKFKTNSKTLARHPDSIFPEIIRIAQQASPPHKSRCDYIFIDRDSKHFRFILNFMRQGEEVMRGTALRNADHYVLNEMLCEVRYYKLKHLELLLQRHQVRLERKVLTFVDLVKEKYFQPTGQNSPKYCTTQQLLFKCQNLKGIVFENVLFSHSVSFAGSILEEAKFKQCVFRSAINFTGADMYRVSFENCVGVSPDRFNLDGEVAAHSQVTFNPPLNFALTDFTNAY